LKRVGSNSAGNTNRDLRRFLRESGYQPTAARIQQVQREVTKSQTENERTVARAKEQGGPSTVDARGRDAQAAARARVQAELARRGKR
jgi:DNA-binding protein YbaB